MSTSENRKWMANWPFRYYTLLYKWCNIHLNNLAMAQSGSYQTHSKLDALSGAAQEFRLHVMLFIQESNWPEAKRPRLDRRNFPRQALFTTIYLSSKRECGNLKHLKHAYPVRKLNFPHGCCLNINKMLVQSSFHSVWIIALHTMSNCCSLVIV